MTLFKLLFVSALCSNIINASTCKIEKIDDIYEFTKELVCNISHTADTSSVSFEIANINTNHIVDKHELIEGTDTSKPINVEKFVGNLGPNTSESVLTEGIIKFNPNYIVKETDSIDYVIYKEYLKYYNKLFEQQKCNYGPIPTSFYMAKFLITTLCFSEKCRAPLSIDENGNIKVVIRMSGEYAKQVMLDEKEHDIYSIIYISPKQERIKTMYLATDSAANATNILSESQIQNLNPLCAICNTFRKMIGSYWSFLFHSKTLKKLPTTSHENIAIIEQKIKEDATKLLFYIPFLKYTCKQILLPKEKQNNRIVYFCDSFQFIFTSDIFKSYNASLYSLLKDEISKFVTKAALQTNIFENKGIDFISEKENNFYNTINQIMIFSREFKNHLQVMFEKGDDRVKDIKSAISFYVTKYKEKAHNIKALVEYIQSKIVSKYVKYYVCLTRDCMPNIDQFEIYNLINNNENLKATLEKAIKYFIRNGMNTIQETMCNSKFTETLEEIKGLNEKLRNYEKINKKKRTQVERDEASANKQKLKNLKTAINQMLLYEDSPTSDSPTSNPPTSDSSTAKNKLSQLLRTLYRELVTQSYPTSDN